MDIQLLRTNARERLKPYCRVCRECDGKACAGEMPGLGGTGSGSSFMNNINALAQHKLNLRTLHSADSPDTQYAFLEKTLSAPLMAAPITAVGMQTGGKLSDKVWAESAVLGSEMAGTIAWTGDGPDPAHFQLGIEALTKHGVQGIPVIKPRENKDILEYIKRAEEAGALAVGIDVDAAGIINMKLKGQPVGPKNEQQLRDIVKSTSLPVFLKGIMTSDEADLAVKVGAAGIVVSNHGGRVLDHTPGAAEVLSEIASEVSGRIPVLVDGGIRSGADIVKMLALGADAVLIGRPLLVGAAGGGAEGVAFILNKLISEMKVSMILTGCSSLGGISSEILR
ncbi:MAG: 4-hydroxymandelate oxidase [Candidatus Dichloromethanomonas elyunquensis]|nr:MAG: 4-hydroxymandelate oxidase [Candidatus Dichloromethanomonas elyunquensis]